LARYGASVGKVFWAENGAYNVAMAKVEKLYNGEHISDKFLFSFYKAPLYQTLVLNNSRSAQAGFNKEDLNSLFIPIPPLNEQKRIVQAIENIEPLLAEYDRLEQQATQLDTEIYDKLKKSILQYAIQGKLVEQDENDEPASVLLERIRAEKKAQLGKKYVESYIYKGDDNCYYEHIGGKDVNITEEIPFDLPNSWEWARIGNIFATTSGTTPNRSEPNYYASRDYNWVRTTDLNNDELFSAEIQISTKAFNECRLEIIPLDSVCIAMYGGAGTIGKNAMIKFKTTINQSVCAIHPNGYCDMKFLQYYMQFYRPFWMEYASGSRKDPNINQVIIKNTFIPIPPLAEQKRIVDKINEIFAKL